MLCFIPNCVFHLLAGALEEDLCRILYQKWCPVSYLLYRWSVLSFVPNLWFVFCCKVGWSLLCNVFYVISCLFHINLVNCIKFNVEWCLEENYIERVNHLSEVNNVQLFFVWVTLRCLFLWDVLFGIFFILKVVIILVALRGGAH